MIYIFDLVTGTSKRYIFGTEKYTFKYINIQVYHQTDGDTFD